MKELLFYIKNEGLIQFILILSSFLLALKIPDWDLKFKLRHRSIITHSPLLILILLSCYKVGLKYYFFKYFIIGFSLGISIHLLFDLFPKKWHGGALLKIPFNNITCTKKTTKKIFLLTIIFGIFVAVFYTDNIYQYFLIFLLAICSLIKKSKYEVHKNRPLLMLLGLMIFCGILRFDYLLNIFKDMAVYLKKFLIK